MIEKSAITDAINSVLQDELEITIALVPGLAQLASQDKQAGNQTLQRLQLEAIRRVWTSADINALALVVMLGEDYDLARSWVTYIETAQNRDQKLLEDLSFDAAQARATTPLRATVAMVQTLAQQTQSMGSLPAVSYALFVDWHASNKTELAPLLESAGAKPKHEELLVDIAHGLLVVRPNGLTPFTSLLRQHSAFLRAAFAEVLSQSPLLNPQANANDDS